MIRFVADVEELDDRNVVRLMDADQLMSLQLWLRLLTRVVALSTMQVRRWIRDGAVDSNELVDTRNQTSIQPEQEAQSATAKALLGGGSNEG